MDATTTTTPATAAHPWLEAALDFDCQGLIYALKLLRPALKKPLNHTKGDCRPYAWLEADGTQATLTAGNGLLWRQVRFDCGQTCAGVGFEAELLLELLDGAGGACGLEVYRDPDACQLVLKTARASYTLPAHAEPWQSLFAWGADDRPADPLRSRLPEFEAAWPELLHALRRALPYAAPVTTGIGHHYTHGVWLGFGPQGCAVAGTDGHAMLLVEKLAATGGADDDPAPFGLLLAARALAQLLAQPWAYIPPRRCWLRGALELVLEWDDCAACLPLIDLKAPDWRGPFAKLAGAAEFGIDACELRAAVLRVERLMARDPGAAPLRLSAGGGELRLRWRNAGGGPPWCEAEERISANHGALPSADTRLIAVSPVLLLQALGEFTGPVTLAVTDETLPLLVTADAEPGYRALVMPVRTDL